MPLVHMKNISFTIDPEAVITIQQVQSYLYESINQSLFARTQNQTMDNLVRVHKMCLKLVF